MLTRHRVVWQAVGFFGALAITLLLSAGGSAAAVAATPVAPAAEARFGSGAPDAAVPDAARDPLSRSSDQRQRLPILTELAQPPAAIQAPAVQPAGMLFGIQADMYEVRTRLKELSAALPRLASIGPFIVARVSKGYESDHAVTIVWSLMLIFGSALAAEALFRRMFRPVVSRLPTIAAGSEFGRLGVLLFRALIRLLAVATFAAAAILLFLLLYKGHEAARLAFWTLFALIVLVRVVAVVLGVILAPDQPALRLPPVDDRTAWRLYGCFCFLAAFAFGSALFGSFLRHIGVAPDLILASGEVLLLMNVAALIAVIWTQRAGIASLLGVGNTCPDAVAKGLRGLFVRYWHIFAVTYVFLMGILASMHRLRTGEMQASRNLPTIGILIAIPLIDGLLRMTVRRCFASQERETPTSAGVLTDPAAGQRLSPPSSPVTAPPVGGKPVDNDFGGVVLRNGRILLAVVVVVLLAEIWNIHLQAMATEGLGPRIAGALFDIVMTLILASAGWGIVRTAINRHLPHESRDALALADGEVGGTGLSRLETLLPLLRKFLFIALVIIVAMIVLSSMGISIGPLLAGAGVIGIAVGFGAQTLVRDIISGVFFLIDDAFRVGEYIDVGEGKGTVERMSVRSLMLRHHLGQVHTIPFGVIRRVTNYSRDWAIMKLELRVPFDTDMEKLRKIVKKVGADMMVDPTYGPHFIQPLKSQGVHRMDDSSFIVRVKFMAKPGEQFVLRREVFRRVQQAFHQNGIKFAPRRVIVDAAAAPGSAAAAAIAGDQPG